MKRLPTLALSVLLILPLSGISQAKIELQTGLSYIEHFSVAAGIQKRKHHFLALAGTNFFVRTRDFSDLFLQYHRDFPRLKFSSFTPQLGFKGGQTIFSDKYYRWTVVSLIPFIGIQHPLSGKTQVFIQGGVAFSLEQKVVRLNYGELGHYRDVLPEIKAGISFHPLDK